LLDDPLLLADERLEEEELLVTFLLDLDRWVLLTFELVLAFDLLFMDDRLVLKLIFELILDGKPELKTLLLPELFGLKLPNKVALRESVGLSRGMTRRAGIV